jgi:hypothetical protein
LIRLSNSEITHEKIVKKDRVLQEDTGQAEIKDSATSPSPYR